MGIGRFDRQDETTALFTTSPAITLIIDPHERIIAANAAAARFYGWSVEDLCAKTLADLAEGPEDKLTTSATQTPAPALAHHSCADGSLRTVELARHDININNSTHQQIVVYDLTDWMTLKENLLVSEQIVSTVTELLSFVDRDYVYRMVNPAYCRYHDKQQVEIIGRSIAELNGQAVFDDIIKPEMDQAFSGQPVSYDAWFDFAGKGRCYANVEYIPVRDTQQEITGVVVAVRDITERKNIADELATHREQLEEVVEQRTQTLELRNQELERMNKVMVGRELKMVELKEENRQLKDKLQQIEQRN